MTASGIYHVIARRGRECGIEVFPHRFLHASATPGSAATAPGAT
jgi:hypothetical protein